MRRNPLAMMTKMLMMIADEVEAVAEWVKTSTNLTTKKTMSQRRKNPSPRDPVDARRPRETRGQPFDREYIWVGGRAIN